MQHLYLVQVAFAAGDAAVWPSERTAVAIGAIFVGLAVAVLGYTRHKN